MAEPSPSRARGSVTSINRATWWDRLWQPFWMLPMIVTVAAVTLGAVMPEVDRDLRELAWWVFPGGADAARGALTTIASVTISTVGVVFSITMVVLQLASSQFTPRVLGSFLSNRIVQVTFGLFIATFVFALTVLRSVLSETEEESGFVPRVSVSFAFLLVLGCVGMFLAFLRTITDSIQVSTVISRIGDRTMSLVNQVMPDTDDEDAGGFASTWSPDADTTRVRIPVNRRHGHVDELDLPRLVSIAAEHDGVLVLAPRLGDFTTRGQELATFWGDGWDDDAAARVNGCVRLSTERSMRQDVTFGFRQLVDIGDRALSPGTNDPTTATQVIHEVHHLLREVVQRTSPSPYIADEQGVVRLVVDPADARDLVRFVVEELGHYGQDAPEVRRHLIAMLDDLHEASLARYRSTITRLRDDLDDPDAPDEREEPSSAGVGGAPDQPAHEDA